MPATLTCCNCGHELTRPDIKPLESPFPDLLNLHSNVVLPSSQTNIIASLISSALYDVSQLDQDILRLENTLHELSRKRDEKQSFYMAHKALVSPIRRVPPEIITEIFLHSAGGHFGNPIILASICSRWRSIAFSSPQLWASFTIAVNPGNLVSHTALAKMWLSRAGKHPLSINLSADTEDEAVFIRAELAKTQSLVNLFVARCEQWQTIKLSLPPAIIKCFLEAKDRLHRLEKLTFGDEIDWHATCQNVSAIFATAPKLRSLHFDYLTGTRPQLPWRQLHELSVDGALSAQSFLDILKTMSSLQKCNFVIRLPGAQNTHAPSSISLPMLRCMEIRFFNSTHIHPQGMPHFLSALHVPAIQELAIYTPKVRIPGGEILTSDFPSAVANAIVAMISHGSLLKLTLGLQSTIQITPASAVSILRAAPKLMELSLRQSVASILSREFVDQFNAPNASLVPNLQKLDLECFSELDIPFPWDMIEGRCLSNYIIPLKQLFLRWYIKTKPIDPALKSRLLRMAQSGLDVQLISYGEPPIKLT